MAKDVFEDAVRPEGAGGAPSAHGQAALLLVESLVHALISKSVISVAEAVEIIEVAADVAAEIVVDAAEAEEAMANRSITLLGAISESLKPDIA
ncbi:hypothetical protein [Caulobacter soli]|uniref:hypothetical protein n=1 Tax=Caulobacter soli TaxID=2708539 RepID=UPI0013ECE6B5|nr:hypothetical protein [Caulobacter soli]